MVRRSLSSVSMMFFAFFVISALMMDNKNGMGRLVLVVQCFHFQYLPHGDGAVLPSFQNIYHNNSPSVVSSTIRLIQNVDGTCKRRNRQKRQTKCDQNHGSCPSHSLQSLQPEIQELQVDDNTTSFIRKSSLQCFKNESVDQKLSKKKNMVRLIELIRIINSVAMIIITSSIVSSSAIAAPLSVVPVADGGSASMLSQTEAFRQLPRERQLTQTQRQLEDLKNLQDSRLDICAERGIFWEQCFMFGTGSTTTDHPNFKTSNNNNQVRQGGLDSQLLSPMGAFEPSSITSESKQTKMKPPTWSIVTLPPTFLNKNCYYT